MTDTKDPSRSFDVESGETTPVGPGWASSTFDPHVVDFGHYAGRRIDELAESEDGRVWPHPLENVVEESPMLDAIFPADLAFDPERPLLDERDWERLLAGEPSVLRRAFERLKQTLTAPPGL